MRYLAVFLIACGTRAVLPTTTQSPAIPLQEVERRIPAHVDDREGWARDVLWALNENNVHPDANAVCAVLAIVAQESGFHANPVVPGLPQLARQQIDKMARSKLSFVGPWAVDKIFERRMPNSRLTYEQKLARARTEQDVDLIFRALISELPFSGPFHKYNPITTAGSMQVSVRFAEEYADEHGQDDEGVRDALYTRDGGLYYGVARLFFYDARYDDMLYRFADYNAGVFASRNAALQRQLSRILNLKLAEDGDILAYDKGGDPTDQVTQTLRALEAFSTLHAPTLRVARDARLEKEEDFEMTETYRAVKAEYRRRFGNPAYAVMPNVTLHGVKMTKARTTEWFAKSVHARYQRCLQ